jgi:hypothetical protein
MPSGRRSRQQRRQAPPRSRQRIKLPDGTSIEAPDPDHPARDAISRVRAGTPQPGDAELVAGWLAETDPRYLQYMAWLGAGPREAADVVPAIRTKVQIPAGAREKILGTLAGLAASGELGMCAHVRPLAPAHAWWVAWAPRKLRCQDCAELVSKRITGTTADRQCDACGHIGKYINKLSVMTPPAEHNQVVVRILVVFGLCNRCAGGVDVARKWYENS